MVDLLPVEIWDHILKYVVYLPVKGFYDQYPNHDKIQEHIRSIRLTCKLFNHILLDGVETEKYNIRGLTSTNVILRHILSNNINALTWGLKCKLFKFNYLLSNRYIEEYYKDIAKTFICDASIDVIEFARNYGLKFNSNWTSYAVFNKNLKLLKYLYRHGCPIYKSIYLFSIYNFNKPCADWLYSKKFWPESYTISNKDREILEDYEEYANYMGGTSYRHRAYINPPI